MPRSLAQMMQSVGESSSKAAKNKSGLVKKGDTKVVVTAIKGDHAEDLSDLKTVEFFVNDRESRSKQKREEEENMPLVLREALKEKKRKQREELKKTTPAKKKILGEIGYRCHMCKQGGTEEYPELIECHRKRCGLKFCQPCLLKYDIVMSVIPTKSKAAEKEKEIVNSKEEEDPDEPLPEEETNNELKWLCPVCERICICAPCRHKAGLPVVGTSYMRIRRIATTKFNSLYDYFIWCRDNKKDIENELNKDADNIKSTSTSTSTSTSSKSTSSNSSTSTSTSSKSSKEEEESPKKSEKEEEGPKRKRLKKMVMIESSEEEKEEDDDE